MSRATVLRSMSYRYSPMNCFLPGTIFMLWLTHSQNAITRTAPMTAWRMWLVTQMSDHAQCAVSPASQAWLGNSGRDSNEPTPNVGGAFPSSGRKGVASGVTLSLSSRVRPGGPLGRPVSLVDDEDAQRQPTDDPEGKEENCTQQVITDPAKSSVQQRTRQNVTQRSIAIAGFTSSFAHGTASLAALNGWVISPRIGRVEDRDAQRAGHQDQSREPSHDTQHDPCEEPAGVQGSHGQQDRQVRGELAAGAGERGGVELAAEADRRCREQDAEEHRAGVPHKHPRGKEIVAEEPDAHTGRHDSDEARRGRADKIMPVSYTHLRAHETGR